MDVFSNADLLYADATRCYIYTLHASNDPTRRPRYVGITRDLKNRSRSHNFGIPHGRKGEWVKEVRASGGEIILTVIFQFRSDDLTECGIVEGGFISRYRERYPDLLNDAGAGNGIALASDKTKALISKSSKGRKWPEEARKRIGILRTGKPLSEKHRAAISKGSKGKKLTPEHIAHNRKARLGIPHSIEIRKKISEGGKGKRRTLEQIERYRAAAQKRYADPIQRAKFDAIRKLGGRKKAK